ncbi:toxin-antitoxin system, antitoxin component domain protein, partial [Bifidobacteriaceae bacterium GH022]
VHNYEGMDLEILYFSVKQDSKKVIEILTEYIDNNKEFYTDNLVDFTRVNKPID